MRFLADENFPGPAIEALERCGHDVVSVARLSPGMADKGVYAWAAREDRTLLTFDKDFGDIARVSGLPDTSGIVLFRMPMPPRSKVGAYVVDIINAHSHWAGHFSVIESDRIRTRKLTS